MTSTAALLALALLRGEPAAVLDPAADMAGALAFLNAERARSGAPALVPDPALDRAAQSRSDEVAAADDLDTLEYPSLSIGDRAIREGYEMRDVQEIVLIGGDSFGARLERLRASDPAAFAEALRPAYRGLGAGIAWNDDRIVRTIVLGRSAEDDFREKSAGLQPLEKERAAILERVNAERSKRRLPPLVENALLDQAAQGHADDMIARSYYGHESPEGASVMDRVRSVGYPASAAGENIAEGQGAAAEVMDGWMRSPRHRDNILRLSYREIGMGVAFGHNARGWEIVWVQVFGSPRGGESVRPRRRT